MTNTEMNAESGPLVGPDDELRPQGRGLLTLYARDWLKGRRNLGIEREFTVLADRLEAVRTDLEFARRWAS